MSLADLIRRLDGAGVELSGREVAECLWLAAYLPAAAPAPAEAEPESDPAPGPATGSGRSPVRASTEKDGAAGEDAGGSTAGESQPARPTEATRSNNEVELYPAGSGRPEPASSPYVLQATRVRAPGGRALPNARTLARAFRPLMRPVRSRTQQHLDLEATAERIAEQRLLRQNAWAPVLRPALIRDLEIVLIVDRSSSMELWDATATELQQLLAHQGAFRDVQVWGLDTQSTLAPQLFAPGSPRTGGPSVSQTTLLRGAGTRLLVVLTDCLGAAWRDGRVQSLLAGWAGRVSLALFHVCPEHLWSRSGLGAVDRLVSSQGWVLPNSQLQETPRAQLGAWDDEPEVKPRPGVLIPVVALEPYALANWSRMVAGMGRVCVPAVRVSVLAPSVAAETQPEGVEPLELLQRFQASASPLAQRLAGLLASAPLNLPVMRLVQQALLPSARHQHLAEVLTSGLVRRLAAPEATSTEPAFEFVAGVRELLRRTVRKSESARVIAEVGKLIGGGEALGGGFDALAVSPGGAETLAADPQRLPFARLQAEVLESLGALYRPAAQQLQAMPEAQLPPPVQLRRELPPQPDVYFRMAWSPDGSLLAAPTRDGRILLWPVDGERPAAEIKVSGYGVNQVAWSPDGTLLAAASFDRIVRVWRLPEQRLVAELKAHQSDVRTVAWSPDGRYLATGTKGGTVRLWQTETWRRFKHFNFVHGAVVCLAWSADGRLAAGYEAGAVFLWQDASNDMPQSLAEHSGSITALAWDPSGQQLLVATGEGQIWVGDGSQLEAQGELAGHQGVVKSLVFSPGGQLLASESSDGTVRLWRGGPLEFIQSLPEPASDFTYPSVAFHPHLPLLATTGAQDRSIRLWDLDIARLLRQGQKAAEPVPPPLESPDYWSPHYWSPHYWAPGYWGARHRAPRYWALLIGLDRFADTRGFQFDFSVKEVTTLAARLRACGYEVEVLANEAATQQGIRHAVQRLQAQGSPGDLVFIHASGFGDQVAGRAALYAYDTDWHRATETSLPLAELWNAWPPETKVVLSLDAGLGDFIRAAAAEFKGPFLGVGLNESPELRHGVLSFFLIQALSEPSLKSSFPLLTVGQLLERVQEGLLSWLDSVDPGTVLIRPDLFQDQALFPTPGEEAEPPRTLLHVTLPPAGSPLTQDWLTDHQLVMVVALTPEDALSKLSRGRYDVLLCGPAGGSQAGDYSKLVAYCQENSPPLPFLLYPGEQLPADLRQRPELVGRIVETADELLPALLRALNPSAEVPPAAIPSFLLRRDLPSRGSVVGRVAWSPTHRYLAEGCRDRMIRIWDPEEGRVLVENTAHHGAVYSLAWSPVAPILASGGTDGHVRFWSPEGEWSYRPLPGATPRVYDLAWSPDGEWLVIVGSHQLFEVIQVLPPPTPSIAPDTVWEPARRIVPREEEGRAPLFAVAWSPDGALIAVGGKARNRAVQLWHWSGEGLEPQGELLGHEDWVTHLAWSSGEPARLASASGDQRVRIWDIVSGKSTFSLEGHEQTVLSVSWSADGHWLATRSLDGSVRLWSATDGIELARARASAPENVAYWPAGLAFHPRVPVLAGPVNESRGVRLWNLSGVVELTGLAPSTGGATPAAAAAPLPPTTVAHILDTMEVQLREHADAGDLRGAWRIFQQELGGYENLGWRLADTRRLGRILLGHQEPDSSQAALDWNALPAPARLEFLEAAANTARDLGQLGAATSYYEAAFRLAAEHSWPLQANAARSSQAEVDLLRGDLSSALSRLDSETTRNSLLDQSPAFRDRAGSLRGYAKALAGDLAAAESALVKALDTDHLTVDKPEDAHGYLYRAHALLLLGRIDAAEQLVIALDAACTHRLETAEHGMEAHCWLLRAELAVRRDEWEDAGSYLTDVEGWLQSREHPEIRSTVTRLRTLVALDRSEAGDPQYALDPDLTDRLRTAPSYAEQHGLTLLAVDLQALRARVSLVRRAGRVAESDAHAALDSATACGYAWGRAEALHCLTEALWLSIPPNQASRALIPDTARQHEAQDYCRQAISLRQALRDPRLPQTEALAVRLGLDEAPKPAGPRQWILIVGSSREPLDPLQVRVAETLGRKLAEAGYGLILDARRGIEVEAAREFTATLNRSGLVVDPWLKQILLARWPAGVEGGQRIKMNADDRRRQGVELADALVVIGGGSGTAASLEAAQQAGKPYVPISGTGGMAHRAFEGLRGSWTPQTGRAPALPEIQALERRLETVDDVEAVTATVVRILQSILSPDGDTAAEQSYQA